MDYRILGNTTLSISVIGFGCMSLGGSFPENERLIHAAINQGINFFDTADLYQKGKNEESLGIALKQKRNQVILASKVGNKWKNDGSGWTWNPRKDYILKAVEESLKRLQTDYLDLYQLHGGTIEDPIEEVIDAFETLKQKGRIRYYGISSIRPHVIRRYLELADIASVMMQYSLLDRRPAELFPLLQEKHVSVLARGCLAGGLLVNKPACHYLDHSPDEVGRAASRVQQLSGSNRTAAQTALSYALQPAAIASAVVGIRTLKQLSEAVAAPGTGQLNNQEIADLSDSIAINQYRDHR